ncbi:metallophosphoesterase family protein [Desmospora profundinema]|uniref:DNA repair exonuclease SbcCD nuclease subunit n=1 Tax=Desmospora profundinema TaxID=1571184 RepID=A0ABU1IHK8_9BACL|nr:metallophosphoesterase family protein [Desmospora profundinema]MDR6224258.1 DNA repair exonuclease SbcCD nuclease subunit [Desmospora profundinema]
MVRLLYVTDTHIRGTAPRSRVDDFVGTLREKLAEVVEIARRERVDAVLHGGDLFDRPDISPAVVREFARILRQLKVPLYTIAGNHDIYGHNPDTVNRSMLGLLDAFGVIRLLHPGQRAWVRQQGIAVQVTGQPFHYQLDKRDPAEDYRVEKSVEADYAVHMVHGMAVDRALPEGVAHTMVNQLWYEDVDVLLTGHYHAGFPLQHRDGRYIINPGALARINNHPSEMKRLPQVVLLSFGDRVDVRFLPITCASPGEMVLDRSYLEKAAYREEKMASFVQEVRAAGDFKGIGILDIVEEIARLEGIDDEVKAEAMRRIAVAQERLAGEGGEDG